MKKVAPQLRAPSAASNYDADLLERLLRNPQEETPEVSRATRVADGPSLGDKASKEKSSTLDKVDEILARYNTPPELYLKIVGHFTIDNDPVEVFELDLDLSEHVSAFGRATCNGDKARAMDELKHFVSNENSWSSLYLSKNVPLDKPLLIKLIKDYIKSQGWDDELAVIISSKNSNAVITKDSRQDVIKQTGLRVLKTRAYSWFCSKHLTSVFSVASPREIFEAIRPDLRKMVL